MSKVPAMCRMVVYVSTQGEAPAVIAEVLDPELQLCGLSVLGPNARYEHDVPFGDEGAIHTWHWPEYVPDNEEITEPQNSAKADGRRKKVAA